MITPPPPLLSRPQVPSALSICAGLAGLATAIGAAAGGFLQRLEANGRTDFFWGNLLQIAVVLSLIGAALALLRHEAGGPIVAGSGAAVGIVVATTLTSEGFDLDSFLDVYPLRGLMFLGAGVAGGAAVLLGLACLRGRGKPAAGIVPALLAAGVLVCHAGLFRLDDRREATETRPFLGVAVVVAVMVIGCFVGRVGALATAAGAACLMPLYLSFAEFGLPRSELAAIAAAALGAIIVWSVATAVVAGRQATVQPTRAPLSPDPWNPEPWKTPPDPTQEFAAQPSSGFAAPSYLASEGEPTRPLPPVGEATASVGAPFSPEPPRPAASQETIVSTGGQWAPDPYGRHQMRYWDGALWTDRVSDGGVTSSDRL